MAPFQRPFPAPHTAAPMELLVSVPHILFVIRNPVALQEFPEFVLEGNAAVVCFLVLDVTNYGIGL
jgi:hypothetical protein